MKNTSIARRVAAFTGIVLVLGLTACSPAKPQGTELKTDNYQHSLMTGDKRPTTACWLRASTSPARRPARAE